MGRRRVPQDRCGGRQSRNSATRMISPTETLGQHGEPWTAAEIAILRRMKAAGTRRELIVKALGGIRTGDAVKRMARKLGFRGGHGGPRPGAAGSPPKPKTTPQPPFLARPTPF